MKSDRFANIIEIKKSISFYLLKARRDKAIELPDRQFECSQKVLGTLKDEPFCWPEEAALLFSPPEAAQRWKLSKVEARVKVAPFAHYN